MDKQNGDGQDGFKFTPNDNVVTDAPAELPEQNMPSPLPSDDEPLINWSAPNAFSINKNFFWYLILFVITAVLAGGIFLLTKDKITTGVILASGILIGIYAAKKPKVVNYQLTNSGFTVNGRYYQFVDFRSFSIVRQDNAVSAVLTPLKRFVPYSYIFFQEELEDQVASALSNSLPFEPNHRDLIDGFLRKIGF